MSWFRNVANYLVEQWALAGIFNKHVALGSDAPWRDTVREVQYRAFVLLPFRDVASAAYLRDGTDLEASKEAFVRDNLGPNTSVFDAQTTAMLRDVINDMTPEDAFNAEALTRYKVEVDAFIQEVTQEHRRLYGKGHHPNVTRVLRGGK